MPESLAKLIDLALLHPTMTDAEMRAGCEKAKKLGVASVCIKPYANRWRRKCSAARAWRSAR